MNFVLNFSWFLNAFIFDRLYTEPKSGAFSIILNNPIYRDVLKKKLDSDATFNDLDISIGKTLHEPNAALIFEESYVKNIIKKSHCKFQVHWIYKNCPNMISKWWYCQKYSTWFQKNKVIMKMQIFYWFLQMCRSLM